MRVWFGGASVQRSRVDGLINDRAARRLGDDDDHVVGAVGDRGRRGGVLLASRAIITTIMVTMMIMLEVIVTMGMMIMMTLGMRMMVACGDAQWWASD